MSAVRTLQHPDDARHTHRQSADGSLPPCLRRAVPGHEQAFAGSARCGLPPVVAFHALPLGVVVEQEPAAADAR